MAEPGAPRTDVHPLVGVTGTSDRIPFGAALRASGTGWRPLVLLGLVAASSALTVATLDAVRDGARSSLGDGALGLLSFLGPLAFGAGGIAATVVVGRRRLERSRGLQVALVAAAVGSTGVACASSTVSVLLGALVVVAAGGATTALVLPMVLDAHVPELRARAAAAYAAAVLAGGSLAVLVAAVEARAGLTWRAAALSAAASSVAAAVAARAAGDPPVGRFDRDRIARAVGAADGGTTADVDRDDVALTVAEQIRRVVDPRSAGPLLALAALFGVVTVALAGDLQRLLRDGWVMVGPSRQVLVAAALLAGAPGVLLLAGRAEVALRRSPSRALDVACRAATAAGLALGVLAVAPFLPLVGVLLAVAATGVTVAFALAAVLLLTICEPARRGYAATVLGLAVMLGALAGQQLTDTIGSRFGAAWAIEAAALLVLAGANGAAATIEVVDDDLDRALDRMVEVDELATRVSRGEHLPLLACRHLDFSYGQVQVLFDVSFTVDDGEMVALLGTNGAGKSTLLRLISGLAFPSAGAVQYRGADITYVDTDRRVQLGISQVPGGKAAFGNMSVVDNLRAYGHTLRRDRANLERGIDEALAAFPRLAERRNQMASTLSGGEQQMMAVSKALILKPRLLLIDELSLGLAPIVVGQLLEMVRRINEAGTAVVLVEQSVNVALSVVDHAYFMEKGEMRFDGSAADLVERPDLLRSVFLQGATKGLAGESAR